VKNIPASEKFPKLFQKSNELIFEKVLPILHCKIGKKYSYYQKLFLAYLKNQRPEQPKLFFKNFRIKWLISNPNDADTSCI